MQIYDELIARGLLAQVTDEDEIRDLVNNGKATFYIGFDCTADSLTAGHFMALTATFALIFSFNAAVTSFPNNCFAIFLSSAFLFGQRELLLQPACCREASLAVCFQAFSLPNMFRKISSAFTV